MRTIRGPALFLAQFIGDRPPFDRLETLADWAKSIGYEALQIPTFKPAIFDLTRAAESRTYCDEVKGMLADKGLEIAELTSHGQGHCVAVHPACDQTADVFVPEKVRGDSRARQAWAEDQLALAAGASANLGLSRHVTFSGSLLWPYLYPYPPRPAGLVDAGFEELARRWRPILDAFDEVGIDLAFEIHPAQDLHDGLTFEMFLDKVDDHARATILYDPSHFLLQMLDYVGFIGVYRERIRAFHVKDAEFVNSPRTGAYGGYQDWLARAGRFRSPGDGQVDFKAIFSKLAEIDYDGFATVEWECCLKHPEDGAREGAAFVRDHIIRVQDRPFDADLQAGRDEGRNRRMLGLA